MPKVAVISLGSPDYLVDIVADGLIRELGRENIHLSYKQNHMAGDMRYTHLMKGFFDRPNSFPIYEAEALVISNRSGIGPLRDWMGRTGRRAVAILDGEDDGEIRLDLQALGKVYFKREHFEGKPYSGKVRPLPFGALQEEPCMRAPVTQRTVFFMGHYQDLPARAQIGQRLARRGLAIHQTTWPKGDYNRALLGSLIGVSARGWGYDTYRYWEIPYFGACLLSERLPITIPGNFRDGEEAVFFTGPDEFEAKLGRLLGQPEEAARIAVNGKKAVMERHLSTHRARTVLGELL